MHDIAPAPRTIRASIHESTLSRVPRMFSAQIPDILSETLQNARRAGSTAVNITVQRRPAHSGHHHIVTITDDGAGIDDPAVLLTYGRNGWDARLVDREDAAGMGFLSLARSGCIVTSRPRTASARFFPGWTVRLTPDHFTGKQDATVSSCEDAPWPSGTAISFATTEHPATIRQAIENAALYYPLPVTLKGLFDPAAPASVLPSKPFLDGSIHREEWRGIEFGVFLDNFHRSRDPNINFHGHTLTANLPAVHSIGPGTWTVRADIQDCPHLQLVLPARKEVVSNPFYARVRDAALLAVYRAMAAHPDPRPTYADWTRARSLGIHIAPPPARLRPWRPSPADPYGRNDLPDPCSLPQDAIIVDFDPEPQLAQTFWRAADRAGIQDRLFDANTHLCGYAWYDSLPRIARIDIDILTDDRTYALDEFPLAKLPRDNRPRAIRQHLCIGAPDGDSTRFTIPADIAFAGEAYSDIHDCAPIVAADSDIQPCVLTDLIYEAYFSFNDDSGDDSWDTQKAAFERDAMHLATRILCSEDEATIAAIHQAIATDVLWLTSKGRAVTITIRDSRISVTLDEIQGAA